MRILFVFILISASVFGQKQDSLLILRDSAFNTLAYDKGTFKALNTLGHCRCLDNLIGKSQNESKSEQFSSVFSQMYNQFYPLARFVSKESILSYLDKAIYERRDMLEKELHKKDEKFKLENSVFFSCYKIFEDSDENFKDYLMFITSSVNYNKYVLENSRYFEMYLRNVTYKY
ncbi:MAG: hypothetical protein ACO1N0_13240 [Fluviicola sp.]